MQSSVLGIEEGQGKYDSITQKNSFPDTVEKNLLSLQQLFSIVLVNIQRQESIYIYIYGYIFWTSTFILMSQVV